MLACDRKVLDLGSCTGPDRSRKLHETIAASSHRFPFLAVRSSRRAWLLMWCGPRQLPHSHISCRAEKNSNFICSALCPFVRHVFLCAVWILTTLLNTVCAVFFFTHTCSLEMIKTKAVTYPHTLQVSSTVWSLRGTCKTDHFNHNVPLLSGQLSTLKLVYALINPAVTLLPAKHKLYTDLLHSAIVVMNQLPLFENFNQL